MDNTRTQHHGDPSDAPDPPDRPPGAATSDLETPNPAALEPASAAKNDVSRDVTDTLHRQALLMYLQGQTHQQIAAHFNRSDRTIRRWIEKAQEAGLLRVDKLKPEEQISEILFMMDEHRARLMDLCQRARDSGDHRLELRCLKELKATEQERLRILEKTGLFDLWDRTHGNTIIVRWLTNSDVEPSIRNDHE